MAVTAVGVSICVMFLTGTMALMGGLHSGTEALANRFDQGFLLAYEGLSLSDSRIPQSVADSVSLPTLQGYVTRASLKLGSNYTWEDVATVWVDDPGDILGLAGLSTLGDEVLLGSDLLVEASTNNVSVNRGDSMTLSRSGLAATVSFNGTYASTAVFPGDWAFVSREVFEIVGQGRQGGPSWMLLPPDAGPTARQLEEAGLTVVPTVGVVEFFAGSVRQAENALWTVVLLSGGIITLLVYNFLSVEIVSRVEDIRIIRNMGARRSLILEVFLGKCLFVSLVGGVLGLSLGIIAANAVVSGSQLLTSGTFIFPQASAYSLGVPLLVAVVAGLGGGAVPAVRAARLDLRRAVENAA